MWFNIWRQWLGAGMYRGVRRPSGRQGLTRSPCSRAALRLEFLECRWAPAAVTTLADSGPGSLRQAILDANAHGGDTITFAVAGTINVGATGLGPLAVISVPVTIDATTAPGYSGSPVVELNGSAVPAGNGGLRFTSNGNTIKGLDIDRFPAYGINLNNGAGNVIQGNYIGTNLGGTVALGNAFSGIALSGNNNTIGGTTAAARNVISGNANDGIDINSGATGNLVEGNYIGTNAAGTAALPNAWSGVFVGGSNNTVGGTAAAARNILSGNGERGVFLSGSGATHNVVAGNYIGTDVTGSVALGNIWEGVGIWDGCSGNTVGGLVAGAGNLISGNKERGMFLTGSGTSNNLVAGNYIGTDVTGTVAVGNTWEGVGIDAQDGAASGNTVGGVAIGARNLISGNLIDGITISGGTGSVVQGNSIGTDVTGTKALPNADAGVGLYSQATNNTIGGTEAGAGNLISGNTNVGVGMTDSGTTGNIVQGNEIGTDLSGTQQLGNAVGVILINGASNNTIGGTAAGAVNLISGNVSNGIRIEVSGTTGNLVLGNFIGTDVTGTQALGNGSNGVDSAVLLRSGASNNTIGGTVAGAGNVIAGDGFIGVHIADTGTTGNVVQGNYIGTDVTGAQPLGNSADGVAISDGASGNLIGGTAPGAGNVISANGMDGVHLFNGATGNMVQGNLIGTDASGTQALGNGLNGAHLEDTSDNNLIGGTASGTSNVIVFNGNDGVLVHTATGDAIQQNSIHDSGNLGIELINNGNNNQAYPVLSSAASDGNSTTIAGTLTSTPDTTFTLDFYANAVANPSGNGEGEQYLGSCAVTTDDSGNANFTVTFTTGDTTGLYIAATATDPANDTSAFSADVVVNGPSAPGGAGRNPQAIAIAGRKLLDSVIRHTLESVAPVMPMRVDEPAEQAFRAARAQHDRAASAFPSDAAFLDIAAGVDGWLEGMFSEITDPTTL